MKAAVVLLALGIAAPLQASVPVPKDIRNPFAVPDPTSFKSADSQKETSGLSAEEAARILAFQKVETKLRSLPVKGFAGSGDRRDTEHNTLLLGPYIIKHDTVISTADFGVDAIIRVLSVQSKELVASVTIGLETKTIRIPLAR